MLRCVCCSNEQINEDFQDLLYFLLYSFWSANALILSDFRNANFNELFENFSKI